MNPLNLTVKTPRVASIDIFRALTMLLMIFVNDLWTLTDIPRWLGHKLDDEDGMGLADGVFPAFLFIVGLSVPLAIQARKQKGQSTIYIFGHIVIRSLALIVMGVFMVNLENINNQLLPYSKHYWQILMTLAFFLIWNYYRDKKALSTIPQWVMQILGVGILIYLAVIFKGGSAEDPQWMRTYWWGILGLIGWGYLVCATLYLVVGDKLLWIGVICLVFYLLNVQQFVSPFDRSFKIVVGASVHASVMTGVLTTLILLKLRNTDKSTQLVMALLSLAAILIIFGFVTRPEWGISKIRATPSWTAICAGISIVFFLLIYLIADKKGFTKWANPIAPAGRSTLTCYLLPYYVYAIIALVSFELPGSWTNSYIGIFKSLVFSYLIIALTGLLEKIPLRLKI
ncbi:MAG: heparan-alpha-glucosaminide N-acetyltransferase domain-containing protein [Cyclobacteriaceae bacterium]